LFVLGWAPSGGVDVRPAEAALRDLVVHLPFLDADDLDTWSAPSGTAVLVSVAHRPEQTGGVRYVHREKGRMACFSGRPFRWVGQAETDGRSPLDPRFYLALIENWMRVLDGRAVAARYDDATRTLDLWTDPLGSYPVFTTERDGVRWISNNAEVLRALHGSDAQDPAALAGLLGGGWPLDGHPRWAGVKRLPSGVVHHYRPDAPNARTELLPLERLATLYGAGWNPQDAAEVFVAAFRGLADWPGRPSVLGVSGGRDSRLVLAAASRAGVDFTATTEGDDDDPEVVIARLLCQTVGVPHDSFVRTDEPQGSRDTDPEHAARVLDLVCSGTASLGDARSLPLSAPPTGPLILWHSGHGGEPGRAYWGLGEVRDREGLVRYLSQRFLNPRPWRPDLLSPEGRDLVQYRLRRWVDELLAAGVSAVDVVDAFYLLVRMGVWAGPTHSWHEWVRDTTAPLWSLRLLPHLLGPPADDRSRDTFYLRVLEILAPRLVNLPIHQQSSTSPGSSWRRDRIEHARKRARQVVAELRRRGPRRLRPPPPPGLPPSLLGLVRERTLAQRDHAAWSVLDERRVEHLLALDPRSLDVISAAQVWRLATVFLTETRTLPGKVR
jgi:hypothetical protein